MNKASKRIIKSLLASAVLSLFHSQSKADVPTPPSLEDLDDNDTERIDVMKQRVFVMRGGDGAELEENVYICR